ncbi:MAG: glycosyltransferase [Candidatus Cybelea sp.]|jgi:glycosyltransferase involved in cell wall biosynthesis
MPLVSVIVPLYNKAPYVLRALESVAAQAVEDFEVIVVDDGSTDGGGDIVAGIPDSRFRLIRQANAGPGAARNRGLREARAPYVAFLDADDRWLPNFLSENVSILERHPSAAAVSCGWYEHPGNAFPAKWWRDCHIAEGLVTISPATNADHLVGMIAYTNPSTMLARSESVRRWGGFYEAGCRYGEDATLYTRMFLNEPFYFHARQLATMDVQASELCRNYSSVRPVEPFLLDEGMLFDVCPPPLRAVLAQFLKVRACKTASVLGFWGEWRRANELARRFISPRDWQTPLFALAVLSSSPFVMPIGWAARSLARRGAPAHGGSLRA